MTWSLCRSVVYVVYTLPMKATTYDEPGVVVSFRLPAEQRAELERKAREDRRPLSWVIREAVHEFLEHDGDGEGETA